MPAIQWANGFLLPLSLPRTKTNLVRGDFGWPESTDGIWQVKFKIIQINMYEHYNGANEM